MNYYWDVVINNEAAMDVTVVTRSVVMEPTRKFLRSLGIATSACTLDELDGDALKKYEDGDAPGWAHVGVCCLVHTNNHGFTDLLMPKRGREGCDDSDDGWDEEDDMPYMGTSAPQGASGSSSAVQEPATNTEIFRPTVDAQPSVPDLPESQS